MSDENNAYDEGYDAYWEGVDVSSNPHDEDTDVRRFWEDGWRTARQHDYDESEG
jgi:ribosome modulation factor